MSLELAAFGRDVLLLDGRAITVRPQTEAADPTQRMDLVAEHGQHTVARAHYTRDEHGDAEVRFDVDPAFQNLGIGTLLLEDLAVIALAAGFNRLTALMQPDNEGMRTVFESVGLTARFWSEGGQTRAELDLTAESMLEERAHSREWSATSSSLDPLLHAEVVAVIGASSSGSGAGFELLKNVAASFTGMLYPVHPTASAIAGIPAAASIADVPGKVDVAIIAVPASAVVDVAEECGKAGVRVLVVVTAGFAESGPEGVERQRQLVAVVRRYGMRMIGPNGLGVIATGVGLNSTFAAVHPRPGAVAFASQSGGLGLALLNEVARQGLGISSFVSLGNKADVSGNDLLCAWGDDPATRVILLYLESIGRPDRFARIARTVARIKPVVVLKGGRSAAGARGAQSHTAAIAAPAATADALFEHAGVTRAENLEELLDLAAFFELQSLPHGRRVALVGNAGGLLILAADACEANGLSNPELSPGLREAIAGKVPTAASTTNPVDLLATVSPDALADVVDMIAASGEVDAVAVVITPLKAGAAEPLRTALRRTVRPVPTTLTLIPSESTESALHVPEYPFPERAVRAIARAADRHDWLSQNEDSLPSLDVNWVEVRRFVSQLAQLREGWLEPGDIFELLGMIGVPIPAYQTARTADEVARAATSIGFPVVLKVVGDSILHKSDEGGVAIDVESADEARIIAAGMVKYFDARLSSILVQKQASPGLEVLVGGLNAPMSVPIVLVGAGGTDTEILQDRQICVAPITQTRAHHLLMSLRLAPKLTGYRSHPPLPVYDIVDVITRIGLLTASVPEIAELDLNPVIATPTSVLAVDARIRVAKRADPLQPLQAMRRI
jgi:acetate---CoA ligase (ADP-forming)